jgi:preprotein translocase subunit SecA
MNFDYRKHLVEYDDVLAKQRAIVYEDRHKIMKGEETRDIMMRLIDDELAELVDTHCPGPHSDEWDTTSLYNALGTILPMPRDMTPEQMQMYSQDELTDALLEIAEKAYAERESSLGEDVVRAWERRVLLITMSGLWIHHVDAMDELREAAMLQAFAQQDPLVAYKRQAYDMFQEFQVIFRKNVVYQIYHVLFQPTAGLILQETSTVGAPANGNGRTDRRAEGQKDGRRADTTARQAAQHSKRQKARASVAAGAASGKIGRNEPCYCGSGKKYKYCHGRT